MYIIYYCIHANKRSWLIDNLLFRSFTWKEIEKIVQKKVYYFIFGVSYLTICRINFLLPPAFPHKFPELFCLQRCFRWFWIEIRLVKLNYFFLESFKAYAKTKISPFGLEYWRHPQCESRPIKYQCAMPVREVAISNVDTIGENIMELFTLFITYTYRILIYIYIHIGSFPTKDMQTPSFRISPIFMKDAHSAESNEKLSNFGCHWNTN